MTPELCQSREVWKLPGTIFVIVCSLVATIGCFHFIVSILSRKSIRNNAFNLYVVFLIFPDGLKTLSAVTGNVLIAFTCGLPDWYWYVNNFVGSFYYFSNFYLNCCVAYEIYTMVEESHRLRRTQPPTMRKVFLQVGCVYSLSVLVALWAILDVPWSWYTVKTQDFGSSDGGLFSKSGSMTFCIILILVPILFVIALRVRIWSKKLIQNEGRTRTLYQFFDRITIVFIAMYIPGTALIFAMSKLDMDGNAYYWLFVCLDMIKATQAFITLYIVSSKEDIWNAVVACSCFSAGEVNNTEKEQSDPATTDSTMSTTILNRKHATEACSETKQETQPPGSQQRSINHTGLVRNDGRARDDGKPRDAEYDVSSIFFVENDHDRDVEQP